MADLTKPETVRERVHEHAGAATTHATRPNEGCCSTSTLEVCCEPSAKTACCGEPATTSPPTTCGCQASAA